VLDTIWQGLAAPHAVDLKKYTKEDEIKQHFPRIIENNTANRKLVSMPMVADVGLLYYRTDCCKSMAIRGPPKT
jgi:trehalose/maltose transport system substrate-binding protein